MAQFPSSTGGASGLWSLTDVRNSLMGSNWPVMVTPTIEYLVVAGGGSGGIGGNGVTSGGGGGGAGGMLTGTVSIAAGTSYTITIGAGGTAVSGSPYYGVNGSNSSAFSQTAIGGGGGGGTAGSSFIGRDGGSGGGASNYNGAGSPGLGTVGQGNNGGAITGSLASPNYPSAGGGGAGAVGGPVTSTMQEAEVAQPIVAEPLEQGVMAEAALVQMAPVTGHRVQ